MTGSTDQTAELLTDPMNYAIVQLPNRRFPGVVVQGDSPSELCRQLEMALDGDSDALAGVKADLDEVLRNYIRNLEERRIKIPFGYRPR